MKKELSYRQYINMFLMITLATGFREIPRVAANIEGNSGIIAFLYSLLFTLALGGIIVYFLRAYAGKNLYEICIELFGKKLAKFIAFVYAGWAILNATIHLGYNSYNIQATIMPYWSNWLLILLMLFLVFYAQRKGAKTLFRISEFILGPVLVLLLIIILSSLPMLDQENLSSYQTMSVIDVKENLFQMCSLGGYIIVGLFFADTFFVRAKDRKKGQTRIIAGIVLFTVIQMLISLITIGISGAALTKNYFYPFYIAVKSISLFQAIERLETLIVLLAMLSDFVTLAIFLLIALHCLIWVLDSKNRSGIYISVAIIVFLLTFYMCSTLFSVVDYYRSFIIPINLVLEYGFPVILFFVGLGKQKVVK